MRTGVFNVLKAAGYTVYPPGVAAKATAKPYLVLKRISKSDFEVWPYTSQIAGWVTVDALCDSIVGLLDKKTLTRADGTEFYVEYESTGPDYPDTELSANTRYIRFSTPSR